MVGKYGGSISFRLNISRKVREVRKEKQSNLCVTLQPLRDIKKRFPQSTPRPQRLIIKPLRDFAASARHKKSFAQSMPRTQRIIIKPLRNSAVFARHKKKVPAKYAKTAKIN
ncbi:MAG: hypothetical protein WCP85_18430, partial [Mariniphaga sp.]